MATTYTKTNNYGLNLYGDDDPADLRDGYNDSMHTIDDTLGKHLNRIETLEATDTHDTEVLKTLTGDNTVDAAKAAKTKWDKAGTDAAMNGAALAALGTETADEASASKAKWDKAGTDAAMNGAALAALGTETVDEASASKAKWDKAGTDATASKSALTALGSETTDKAIAARTKWDKASTEATEALELASVPAKLKDYVVVLGDSWVDGYYSGAKHIDESPAVAIKNRLNPTRFYYKGSSAGGFAVIGDDGRFIDIWNDVPDKDKVSAVIIIGGQNDATGIAQNKTTEAFVMNRARNLMESIHSDAPNAEIHVCPMTLAVGQTLTQNKTHGTNRSDRLGVYRVLTLNLKDCGYDYVRIHEGGYRIGVVASQGEGGGNDGDGAHLNRSGYALAGNWIAHCVAANCDLWPTNYGMPDASQILGTWDYVNIFERDGMLYIGYKCNYTTKPANGNRVFKLPSWAAVGNPQYFPSYDGKCFTALDGSTLSVQNTANMDATGILSGSLVVPAGF